MTSIAVALRIARSLGRRSPSRSRGDDFCLGLRRYRCRILTWLSVGLQLGSFFVVSRFFKCFDTIVRLLLAMTFRSPVRTLIVHQAAHASFAASASLSCAIANVTWDT